MKDQDKTRGQLIEELVELRERVAPLEAAATEGKRAEEELRREHQRVQQYLDIAGVIMVVLDNRGNIRLLNRKGYSVLGYDNGELLGKNWFDTCVPQSIREEVKAVFAELMAGGEASAEYYDNPVITKSGEERTIAWHNAVLTDDTGAIVGTLSSGLDITERKRAEEELAKNRAMLHAVIECLPFDFFVIGPDGYYLMENAVCRAHWGRLVGKTPEDMAPTETVRALWLDNNRRALAGEKVENEVTVTVTGEERIVYNVITPIRDETHSYGILGVNIDITERKRAEEALQKAHDELERRVEERTAELTKANEQLTHEVEERRLAEKALRGSEEKYRTLVEMSPDAVIMTDLEGHITYASRRAVEMHGSERLEELLGRNPLDFFAPEDHEKFLANLERNMEETVLRNVEYSFLRKDGRHFAGEASAAVFKDSSGAPAGYVAVVRDITDRKRAEEALRQSLDQLQTIHEGIIEGLLITDIETKRFVRVNSSMCRMLGYSEQELLAASIEDIHPPEEVSNDLQRFQTVAEGRVSINENRPVLRKDGSVFYADITGHPIAYEGRPCVLALFRDITERKQAQEALRQSHDELQAIYDQAVDGIIIADAEAANPLRANAAYCRLLGYSEKEMRTISPERAHPPEVLPAVWKHLDAVRKGNAARIDDLPFVRKDGGIVFADVVTSPILYNQRPCWISFFHDVTERKKAQEALERERQSLWRMLQASDHERQTISYDIHDGLAQYLAAATMQFQVFDHLRDSAPEEAKKAYDAATQLVSQSHSETRRLISEVRPPVIDETGLETAMSHLVHEQRGRGGPKIKFDSDVQFGRLPPILENALYRIVQEALTNACEHSKSKTVTVTLAQEGQAVRLAVRDWGIGFDPESVGKGHFGVEGIRQRVRLLGGRLTIESTPGSGTLVQVVVPIVERPNGE